MFFQVASSNSEAISELVVFEFSYFQKGNFIYFCQKKVIAGKIVDCKYWKIGPTMEMNRLTTNEALHQTFKLQMHLDYWTKSIVNFSRIWKLLRM